MQNKKRARIVTILLALIISSLSFWAIAQTPASFDPRARVMMFSANTGEWVLTTFSQIKPGSEFTFNNQFYLLDASGKAQVVPNVDTDRLVEADLPCHKDSRHPTTSDVVQVLGKDMQSVTHSVLGTVQPGAIIRFQGKAYGVAPDRSLVDFSESTSKLQCIDITPSGMQHVINRHTVGGKDNAGKSIFNARENIQTLIRYAELVAPLPQDRGNFQRVFDAGRAIGTDRTTRKPTSTYTVITTQSGKLVTMFPGMP